MELTRIRKPLMILGRGDPLEWEKRKVRDEKVGTLRGGLQGRS